MKKWKWPGMLLLALMLCLTPARVNAESVDDASVYRNPHIIFTPDGKAYTTDFMEKDYESVRKGEVIETGEVSTLPELQEGQHKYSVKKTGLLHIEKWVADYTPGRCIHNEYWHNDRYHDLTVNHNNCLQYYKNGWLGYCADCHQRIDILYYMDRETARTLTTLPLEMEYFYMCPNCDNLEQARELRHECEDISWNKYIVTYIENGLKVTGIMAPSTFMYNNETMYDGEKITPDTRLRKNRFIREGFEFVGWNTKPDGSGESFTDGQEVYNLTTVDNEEIVLYAQWKKSESTLHIHPGSGKLDGASGIVSVTKKYAATENVSADRLTPPKGAVITFKTNGGSAVADMETTRYFEEWSLSYPFHGELADEVYHFTGPDGSEDAITAVYGHRPITLPDTQKPTLEFGGWYKDPECTQLVGPAGAEVIITQNTTLYAQWVSLQLTATEDYTVYGGSGAVDLSWVNAENTQMTYQVYQMREGGSWTKYENVLAEKTSVEETFSYTGNRGTYTVPYSGLYTLTLTGSQGGSYNVVENGVLQKVMPGGKGGQVKATAFLHAGEILTYNIGSTSGYNGGGTGSIFANGGGMTILSSNTKGTLVIAGGGGGASALMEGGPGGAETSLMQTSLGGSGPTGGGGGYLGGTPGEAIYHVHDDEKCSYHEHEGSETTGGACYSKRICGGDTFDMSGGEVLYYAPHWNNDGSGICIQCGVNFGRDGNNPRAHAATAPMEYLCKKCGARYDERPAACTAASGYNLTCTIAEGYCCGKTEKTVESAKAAYGGSNYVSEAYCTLLSAEAGRGSGNGSICIHLEKVAWVDDLELQDVVARDMESPEAIGQYFLADGGPGQVRVVWVAPWDKGTTYYHQVSGHEMDRGEERYRSNTTGNTLVSGLAGYYVKVDFKPDTKVHSENGSYVTEQSYMVEIEESNKGVEEEEGNGGEEEVTYFHVAAVDRAGNLSDTTHIKVEDFDFSLVTYIQRILEPHEPVFLAGESGILQADAYGYARRVEICYPVEWIPWGFPELQMFDYGQKREFLRREAIQFMVPLKAGEGEYYFRVRAHPYIGEAVEEILKIQVKGSILDELHTRLR